MTHSETGIQRRDALKTLLAGLGVGSVVFQRAVAAEVAGGGPVTPEMLKQAEWVAGLELTDDERAAVAQSVERAQLKFRALRQVPVDYGDAPALTFRVSGVRPDESPQERGQVEPLENAAAERPANDDALAFLPVVELAALLRTRRVSSVELTKLYLDRLHRFNNALNCVVTFTDELALRQAEQADREIAAGRYRGPLHGVPWGAKDLIAYPGYPTTWGAAPFREQVRPEKATVAQRLDAAGAVLVAKLSLGALAWGDEWFGGLTRNPWNTKEGASGSSAGSASATAAGLVGFSLGSETLGSIISPCRVCGTTGLRPTFGRVSRFGCMPLAWSMDKLGPICRSVEDCALVFGAIHGSDGLDATVVDRPFNWPFRHDLRTLRVGYCEEDGPVDERRDLKILRDLGVKLLPICLPDKRLSDPLTLILNAEAATVFDGLTRQGISEGIGRWKTVFRQSEFTPAVEYLRANRVRSLLMREMDEVMSRVDAYVGGDDLVVTNFTGHPTVVLPDHFERRGEIDQPVAITFTGQLFGETKLLALAHAYQQATGAHLRRPPLDTPK